MKSASEKSNVSIPQRLAYCFQLLLMRLTGKNAEIGPWQELEEYNSAFRKYRTVDLQAGSHRILEIGYGARPWRLIGLAGMGFKVQGIDLDYPALGFNPLTLLNIYKQNGITRCAKSAVRGMLFDSKDLRALDSEIKARGGTPVKFRGLLKVGDASKFDGFKKEEFDFIYSEDVFEHIPFSSLEAVVGNMRGWLKPGGIAFVRPNVFTGIIGGHDPDFYSHRVLSGDANPSRAWAHLWDPNFAVDTYLNKLCLADYRDLFSQHFEVLEERTKTPKLGDSYLTDEIQAKIPDRYSKEELFSNQIAFILRRK